MSPPPTSPGWKRPARRHPRRFSTTNWPRPRRVPFPEPVPGLVIRYSYLWAEEYGSGREEGVKDGPCAIILVGIEDSGERMVTVLPVTHAPPSDRSLTVAIPQATKRRLGLDDECSWVALSEAN